MFRKFSPEKYEYGVTKKQLLKIGNADARSELIPPKPKKKQPKPSIKQAIDSVKIDNDRGLFFNGEARSSEEISEESFQEWFKDENQNFLRNYYQQGVADSILSHTVNALQEKACLTPRAIARLDAQAKARTEIKQSTQVNFYYDPEDKHVYCEAISFLKLGTLPGYKGEKHESGIEIYSHFKLLAENEHPKQRLRYDLLEIRTNSLDVCNILRSNPRKDLGRKNSVLSGSFSEIRFSETSSQKEEHSSKKNISTNRTFRAGVIRYSKIIASIFFVIGIGSLVVSLLYFFPPVVLTLPYLGTLLSGSPLAFAGAGCLGAAGAGFLFNRAATSEWFMQKWHQVPKGWKWAAGVAIVFGIAIVVASAVFFPPSLALPVALGSILAPALGIYGGLGLAVGTGLLHLLHILLKKPPKPDDAEPAFAARVDCSKSILDPEPSITRFSLSSSNDGRTLPPSSSRAIIGSITPPPRSGDPEPQSAGSDKTDIAALLPSPFPTELKPSSLGAITPDEETSVVFPVKGPSKEGRGRFGMFSPTGKRDLKPELDAVHEDDSVRPPLQAADSENTSSDGTRQSRSSRSLSPSRVNSG